MNADRRAFLAERRRSVEVRMDRIAADYDRDWGTIMPSHAAFVDRFLASTAPGALVLDAACGTGKYWPTLLTSGRRVVGVDRSSGMLAQVVRKHPGAVTHHLALQDLSAHAPTLGRFDALMCVDAREYLPPEEWPGVLAGFVRLLPADAPMYLTVEQESDDEHSDTSDKHSDPSDEHGETLVAGEVLGPQERGTRGYHFHPTDEQVDRWLAEAGIVTPESGTGDYYRHILARTTGPK